MFKDLRVLENIYTEIREDVKNKKSTTISVMLFLKFRMG